MGRRPGLNKQILNAIDKFTPIIREAFFAALADITDNVKLANVVDALNAGDVVAAFDALGFNNAALRPLTAAVEQSFETGGMMTANRIPAVNGVKFRFDVRNSKAEAWLRDHSSRLVTSISEDTRTSIRNILDGGLVAGRNPRNVALDIVGRIDPTTGRRVGGIVGLTPGQAGWVSRARSELGSPDTAAGYLQRALRDKRFDKIVQKSIDTGVPLDNDTISRLTGRYSDNVLRMRGETIARTEALQSLNQSQDMAFRQAIDEGIIDQSAVQRVWDSSGDARTRETHRAMDGQSVGLDEAFVSPSGARLMFPGDSSLGAGGEEIINCRCVVKHRIDFLAEGLDDVTPPSVAPIVPPPQPVVPVLQSPGGLLPRATAPFSIQDVVRSADPNGEYMIGSVPRSTTQRSHNALPGYRSEGSDRSLLDYVGSGYVRMNGYLRVKAKGVNTRGEPFKVDPELERKINDVEVLMKPSELSFAGYRGVKQEFAQELVGLDVGDTFAMAGFTSVARASEVSLQFARAGRQEGGVLFKFIVPKGTPMITTNVGETELILRSGHEFRIVKIEERQVPNPNAPPPTVKFKVYSLEMLPMP